MAFDRIIYFGDSLTDSDEFFTLSSQLLLFPLPSSLFGYDGQFSNGDVYADIAPELLGIGADESLNYAVGGARAVGVNPVGQVLAASPLAVPNPDPEAVAFDSNLTAQVARFLADAPGLGDLSGSAASFFIGLNDFNGLSSAVDPDPANFDPVAFGAAAQQLAADILSSTLSNAGAAAAAGVGTLILNTLPVGSFFPLTDALPEFAKPLADQLVRDYNDALIAQSAALGATGATVQIVDFEALADEIMANGQSFGFLNTTDSFFIGTGADPEFVDPDGPGPLPEIPVFQENPAVAGLDFDQFVFFDLLHPTTAGHGVFGAFQAAALAGDTIEFLGDAADTSIGGRGADLTFGQGGADRIVSGAGDDVAFGGADDDRMFGARGDDIMAGGAGRDFMRGNLGNDVLAGNTGNDVMRGDAGQDVLIDGLGRDVMFGGADDDTFFYTDAALIGGATGDNRDHAIGGTGDDTLYLAVSDAVRADVIADIAAIDGSGARVFIDALDLVVVQIENVVLLDGRDGFETVTVGAEVQDQLDEAGFWGLA